MNKNIKKGEKMANSTSILIVDDDLGMTETLLDILTDLEYDVTVVNDGYQAIEIFKKRTYNFVLMDIKMPGINGVETFHEIHKIDESAKVIMMTAYSVNDLKREAYDGGVTDILDKPLNIERVLKLIN